MKNKSLLVRALTGLCLAVAALSAGGCQTAAAFQKQMDALDQAGVTAIEITGKFSHTSLTTADVDGKTVSTFEHNNAWVPKVRIVRTRQK